MLRVGPNMGPSLMMLGLQPELKSRVGCSVAGPPRHPEHAWSEGGRNQTNKQNSSPLHINSKIHPKFCPWVFKTIHLSYFLDYFFLARGSIHSFICTFPYFSLIHSFHHYLLNGCSGLGIVLDIGTNEMEESQMKEGPALQELLFCVIQSWHLYCD